MYMLLYGVLNIEYFFGEKDVLRVLCIIKGSLTSTTLIE